MRTRSSSTFSVVQQDSPDEDKASDKGSTTKRSKKTGRPPKAKVGILSLPIIHRDCPDEYKSADGKPVTKQGLPYNIVLTLKRQRHSPQKGLTTRHSKKAHRSPKAGDGISTGPGFVVPPELARLRRKSLYKDLAMFICLEELDRSIEEQIIVEGEEGDDLVETWTKYYEDFLEQRACGYHDEGFGADDV